MKILVSRSRNSKSDEKLTFSKVMGLLDNSESNKKKLWDIIITNPNDGVFLNMIATYATDEDILEYLATNYDYPTVKRDVASNFATSSSILNHLAKDDNPVIRACVARNPNTSVDTLKTLATDSSSYVIDAVISNLNTPNEIIQFLADNDDNVFVKLSALKRLGSSEN